MQNKVKKFNNSQTAHIEPMPTHARILDIESEMGELAKEYLKNSKYGTKPFKLTNDFKEEFGDVLYALISLSNELEIDCEECLEIAINKLQERINNRNDMGSGR